MFKGELFESMLKWCNHVIVLVRTKLCCENVCVLMFEDGVFRFRCMNKQDLSIASKFSVLSIGQDSCEARLVSVKTAVILKFCLDEFFYM